MSPRGAVIVLLLGPLLALLLAGAASAQVLSGTRWERLSPSQRAALAPLAPQWAQLDPGSQDTWAAIALRFPKLSEAEQMRLRERMSAWSKLSPTERERVRAGYAHLQHLPLEARNAKWERFQALPEERKQQLMERAAARRGAPAASAAGASAAPGRPLSAALPQLDAHTLLPKDKRP